MIILIIGTTGKN